jgi:hypothetical protein
MEVIAENRIGRRILRHVQALAYPRFAGSDGEQKAQAYIRKFFQDELYPTTEQQFESSLFPLELLPRFGVLLLCTLQLVALTVADTFPALTIELSILTILLLVLMTRWSPVAEKLYGLAHFGRLRSRNILAVHPVQNRHLNIIFTAHYDSKAQTFNGVFRFALFGATAILLALSAVQILAASFVGYPTDLVALTLIPACVTALLIQINMTTNASPGAYDNGSGVAVMLELAHGFADAIPNANLAFIATGAEEAGLCGAVALMQDEGFIEQFPPERTIIINLDGVGSRGPLRITDRYGIPPTRTGVLVSNLCVQIAHRFGIDAQTNWLPTGAAMDHIPFAAHGYQSVTLSTAGWNKTFRAMHTRHDTVDHLDLASLEYCYAIGQEIVESIPLTIRDDADSEADDEA